MKTITISEAKTNAANMPIPRITGKIKALFDRKTGTNDNGDWSMETGILTDGHDEIKFTLSGCPKLPYEKGTNVVFRCKEGKKGLTGVKIKIEEYKGNSQPVLWITPTAHMFSDMEDSDDIPMHHDSSGAPIPKVYPNAPQANVTPMRPDLDEALQGFMKSKPDPKNDIQEVKRAVMQMANLREICDHAAQFLYPDGEKDFIKEIGTSLFIQATRDGWHKRLPGNKPLSKKEDVEATENLEEK